MQSNKLLEEIEIVRNVAAQKTSGMSRLSHK